MKKLLLFIFLLLNIFVLNGCKSDIRLWLTENQRYKIFIEVVEAEDKAMCEADKQYWPDTVTLNNANSNSFKERSFEANNKFLALQEELSKKYRNEVLKKYWLKDDDFSIISNEALFEKKWELPQYICN